MTPQEILAELRDIHLPETTAASASGDLVLWPLVLVILAALAILSIIWRRRWAWRREVIDDLALIEERVKEGGEDEAWMNLAFLLKRLALRKRTRQEVAALSGEPWLACLDDLIGADHFTKGPGRGLITFPYLGRDLDGDLAARRRDDLLTTIALLRRRFSAFGALG